MKRHGNLYERICDIQNIYLADDLASKGKVKQFSVVNHKAWDITQQKGKCPICFESVRGEQLTLF